MNSALLICSKCNTAEQSEKFATIWDLEMHFARQHFGGRALYECRMNGCEIWFYTQTHLWRHFQRYHSDSEQAKSTKLKLKAQQILNKSIINRVSSTIPESGNEMSHYQCFECNKTKSEMFPTLETLETHIVKKHCDSAVYYECDDNSCGGILQSYGTFLRHYVNEHDKLEENITLKLQIYNSVKESIEKLIFDRSKDHGNPGRGKIAANRSQTKVVENIETNSYSPDSFEEDIPVRSVLRRLSDVLSNDDSGYTDTFEIDPSSSLRLNVCKSESIQNMLRRISDVLNNDEFSGSDTNILPELSNEMNDAFNTTADVDQSLDEPIDVMPILPCENSVVYPDTTPESENNTTGFFDGTEFNYITTCCEDDNSMDVSDIVHFLDFSDETIPPENAAQFALLLEEPSENYELNQSAPEHRCDHCNKSFASESNLSRHVSVLHTSNNKLYQCNLCEFSTIHKHGLKVHMNVHSRTKSDNNKCNFCPYVTKESDSLKVHMQSHACEKPYKCNQCPYAAKERSTLKGHMRSHTGEKPYKCSKCPFASAYSSDLVVHTRKHTGEKPYKCNQCPYAATDNSSVKIHMRRHTGEKPYKCRECTFASATSSELKVHTRTHTGERPYKCNQCTYATVQSSTLKQHMLTHTKSRRMPCSSAHVNKVQILRNQ